jgi:hypothetical protein
MPRKTMTQINKIPPLDIEKGLEILKSFAEDRAANKRIAIFAL